MRLQLLLKTSDIFFVKPMAIGEFFFILMLTATLSYAKKC